MVSGRLVLAYFIMLFPVGNFMDGVFKPIRLKLNNAGEVAPVGPVGPGVPTFPTQLLELAQDPTGTLNRAALPSFTCICIKLRNAV